MIDPKQTDVGRGVIYQGGHPDDREVGVITSFNEHVVFVRYGRKVQATSREDLTWEFNYSPSGPSSSSSGSTSDRTPDRDGGAT